jgi:GNAT superfamily N-acetyltransferase
MTTPILLSTEKDKLGNDINIFRIDSINMSPIVPFYLRHIADLIDNGFSYPTMDWPKIEEHYGAIYAEQDGRILGHIVFSREHVHKEGYLWIALSAVEQDLRGRGIYTMLHPHFEAHAKELGCWSIASYVHKNNKVRLASAEKVGMAPVFYFMGKRLI